MTDEEVVENERKRLEACRTVLENAWVKVASIPEGRRVLLDILGQSEPLARSLVSGAQDLTAEREGRRAVGVYILERLGLSTWAKMVEDDRSDELSVNFQA